VRESDTTPGIARILRRQRLRQAYPKADAGVRETTELTGGEQLVAARCRHPRCATNSCYVQPLSGSREPSQDQRPVESQPTKGNIAAAPSDRGKALGNIQKDRQKCMVDGVLDKAKRRRARAVVHGFVVGRAEMVTFARRRLACISSAGQGNVIGNPILPVIKICAIRAPCA